MHRFTALSSEACELKLGSFGYRGSLEGRFCDSFGAHTQNWAWDTSEHLDQKKQSHWRNTTLRGIRCDMRAEAEAEETRKQNAHTFETNE